jgi:hypothetical protein
MEFRANFWAKMLYNALWLGFFLATLKIIFRHTDSIAGWSESEALMLAATLYFIDALISTLFYFGLSELPTLVRQGTLDFVLFKPVDSQFWLSLRRINLDQLGSLAVAVLLGVYALFRLDYTPSLLNVALYFGMVLTGVLIFYSFHFMMMTLSIWLVRVENLWVLSDVYSRRLVASRRMCLTACCAVCSPMCCLWRFWQRFRRRRCWARRRRAFCGSRSRGRWAFSSWGACSGSSRCVATPARVREATNAVRDCRASRFSNRESFCSASR